MFGLIVTANAIREWFSKSKGDEKQAKKTNYLQAHTSLSGRKKSRLIEDSTISVGILGIFHNYTYCMTYAQLHVLYDVRNRKNISWIKFYATFYKEIYQLESVMAEFQLSNDTLRRMMAKMSADMDAGLAGGIEKSTLAMLPSFVPELPNGTGNGL